MLIFLPLLALALALILIFGVYSITELVLEHRERMAVHNNTTKDYKNK